MYAKSRLSAKPRVARRKPAPSSAPRRRKATTRPRRARKSGLNPAVSNSRIQGMMGMATETVFSKTSKKLHKRAVGLTAEAAPCVWLQTASNSINGPVGQQNITILGQWNSVPDIQTISNLTFANASAVAGQNPTRFCLQSLQAETQIVNTSNVGCQVDIYDIVCKRDAPITSAAQYDVSTPSRAWITGTELQATLVDPGAVQQAYLPGSLPTDSQLFKDFYKVVQRKEVLMNPGGQHTHKVSLRLNKEFDKNQLTTYGGVMEGLKGVTFFTMIVLRGQPAVIPTTQVTTMSNPFLRWITTERYIYSAVYRNGSQFTYGNVLPALPPATALQVLSLNSPVVSSIIGA